MRRLLEHLGLSGPAEALRLAPALGVLVVWTVLMTHSGGFRAADRLPAGLVLAGLLAVAAVGGRRVLPVAGPARWALLAFAAFTAWNFLSIAWSDAPGSAWEASNLLLLTLLGAWTLALAPWRAPTAAVLLAGFSLAVAVVCLGTLVSALGATDLTSSFDDFRWQPPLGYPNTTAAFGFIAAIPMLLVASRPGLRAPSRALAQGLATFLAAFALLPQSRGSVLGGTLALIVLVAVVPWRWPLLAHGALLAGVLALASGPIFEVYDAASTTGAVSGALRGAFHAILLATAAGAAGGAVLALVDARLSLGARGLRAARVAGAAGWVVVGLGLAAVGVAHADGISGALRDQWTSLEHPGIEFAGGRDARDDGSARLNFIDPLERYDYWRVSLRGLEANPIGGMGAGGFEHRYTAERRYPKVSKYPHNLVMKTLGDTGAVGAGLLLAFALLAGRGLLRRRSQAPPGEMVVVVAALGVAAYFFAHGLFDWLEAYPVLTGPVVGFVMVALVLRSPAGAPARRRTAPRRAAHAAAGLAVVLAAASLAAPWLGLRYRSRASEIWRTQPVLAYRDLDRAARVDPLSPEPLVLQGVIGLTRGDLGTAGDGFRRALDREDAWLPHFGLGVIAAQRGDRLAARAQFALALERDRRDPVLPAVTAKISRSSRVDPAAVVREVLTSPLFPTRRLK